MIDLKNKVIVLTGGAGSIGTDAVTIIAENGGRVYFPDCVKEKGEKLEKELKERGLFAEFIYTDVTDDESVKKSVDYILGKEGHIDVMINNVGYNVNADQRKVLPDYDEMWLRRVTNICLDGLYSYSKYVIPEMIKNGGGKIINTGSVTGFRTALKFQAPYNAAKHSIANITRAMALEYGQYGITCNSVIPGSVANWQIASVVWGTEEKKNSMCKHIPLGHVGAPADIGNMMLYLCSDLSDYVNGCMINVDGGWAAGYAME